MKLKKYLFLSMLGLLVACFEDKGNYDYHEVADLTITNIPDVVEVLGGADHIMVSPNIVSSSEGKITEDNKNFTFKYKIEYKSGGTINSNTKWLDINPRGNLNLDTLATFKPQTYLCWFTVTDVRSGRETIVQFDIKVTSTTYEGYMVLCNEGAENRVRLDYISRITASKISVIHDILLTSGMPACNNAQSIGFYPSLMSTGDLIYILTGSGTYKIDKETFESKSSYNIFNLDFIIPLQNESLMKYVALNTGSSYYSYAAFCVSDQGNAYFQKLLLAGGAFESPINTSRRGAAAEYKVAPFIGISKARPGNGSTALFYDTDNKRFVGWAYSSVDANMYKLTPLPNPENKLFDFATGMDLVYMESTRFSNGLCYSILKDKTGKYFIYGINLGSDEDFIQESKYENLNAPEFDKATCYAFHSQFPLMFYAVGNKVYVHNLGTNTTTLSSTVALGANEQITLLKFNLYEQGNLGMLNDKSDAFLARQYELMVGSYDSSVANGNGGKLGFYPVDGVNSTLSKRLEYTGFAKIKDVVYRERR